MAMGHQQLVRILLVAGIISFCLNTADSCMKRQEPVKSVTPSPTEASNIRIEACQKNDTFADQCRNDGQCRVQISLVGGFRTSYCKCPQRYTGEKCERIKLPPTSMGSVWAACIASGVVVVIIIIAVIVIFRIRRQHRENKNMGPPEAGGTTPGTFSQYAGPPNASTSHEQVELLQVRADRSDIER